MLFIKGTSAVRMFAGLVVLVELLLTVVVFVQYDSSVGGVQLVDKATNWIPIESFKVEYFLGVDGLSAPMVLLTGILGMVAVFASWNITTRVREYFFWMFALQTGVMGVFVSLDFLMFFLFWELELVPMFFLITIWGSGRREYSAMKFLIFTFLGSAFMLMGILVLFLSTGTFDMTKLPAALEAGTLILPVGLVFWMLFVGFAVKLPVWPLHTWLPDAHTDAPTAASVMLAGVLLKMGGYGMLRVSATMFPEYIRQVAIFIAILGVINVLYGAIVVFRQSDLKRLIAYSSVSHMGFVLIGLSSVAGVTAGVTTLGLTGAAMQMFTHGTITGLLFLVIGFIYEKAHTRYIPDLGGLASKMPFLATALLIGGFASLGLPGTSGFVAEIMVFLGTFVVWSWPTAIAAFGVVLAAGYVLWMVQRTLFGPIKEHLSDIGDATAIEMVPVAVLVVAILLVGIYPAIISDVFEVGIEPITQSLGRIASASIP